MNRVTDLRAAMADAGIDALVLGREANIHAATGETRLWLAGTRPFTPTCVVVHATGQVFVPSRTWNPARLAAMLQGVEGLPSARRIGVDGITCAARTLLEGVAPAATLVDATALLAAVARIKTEEELVALRAAASVARDAFAEMVAALAPDVPAAHLRGRFAAAAGVAGVPTPAFDAIVAPADGHTWWSTDVVRPGVPLVLRGGVVKDGWEASLARTYRDGTELTPDGWPERIASCRPGAIAAEVGVVHGVGRGYEVLTPETRLAAGMVVAVEVATDTAVRQDVVAVRDGEAEVLTA
jgi:Xaa-Pro aminopeptidase